MTRAGVMGISARRIAIAVRIGQRTGRKTMAEYYERDVLIEKLMMYTWRDRDGWEIDDSDAKRAYIEEWLPPIPAADVLPRDEGIKLGLELAAMHGATPEQQQLEEAYLKGVEDGMTRRNVRPVVLCRDCIHARHYTNKIKCGYWSEQTASEIVCEDDFCSYGEKREEKGT